MTKQTGLHLEYCRMRRKYAVMVMGGGRSPWNAVRRPAAIFDASALPPYTDSRSEVSPR